MRRSSFLRDQGDLRFGEPYDFTVLKIPTSGNVGQKWGTNCIFSGRDSFMHDSGQAAVWG